MRSARPMPYGMAVPNGMAAPYDMAAPNGMAAPAVGTPRGGPAPASTP
ncbi:hypothetical protein [Streptosporangium sp. KLBMP 9127]|nr:hypothetical protein [Streptosporangium sp. KLBMP 9127]